MIPLLSPMAFLYLAAMRSPAYAAFLKKHCSDRTSRFLLYTDEVKPGNVLRSDRGRSFHAWYWQLMDFPPREPKFSSWVGPLDVCAHETARQHQGGTLIGG